MATARFLKLSEEKKQRILQAGFEEFARYPFRDASINRIIKNAEISRGSFYTYFEDKMALLCFILGELIEKFGEEVYGFLKQGGGDPFYCAEQVYDYCRSGLRSNDSLGFVKNLFSDSETLKELMIPPSECGSLLEERESEPDGKYYIHYLLQYMAKRVAAGIDMEKYDLDEEKVKFLYPMIMMVTVRTATTAAEYPEQEAMLRHGMDMELNLLKYGAVRRGSEKTEGTRA